MIKDMSKFVKEKDLKKVSEKELSTALVDVLSMFFEEFNVSGIIKIPGKGTVGIFRNDDDKLRILHHAKIESKKIELEIDRMAINWIQEDNCDTDEKKEKNPTYIR